MIYKLDNIKLTLSDSEDELYKIAENKLGKKPEHFRVLKKSLDARREEIYWVYSIEFSGEVENKAIINKKIETKDKIFIIGSGPAGLFAAIRLIDNGIKPIIIERGQNVEKRERDIENFFENGKLNENSNIQFGEGGAGTFSDGKLFTQTHKGYTEEVLNTFVRFGAPSEVAYLSKPHVGSDNLKIVLVNIRKYIEENGGEFRFCTKFEGICSENGKVSAIRLSNCETNILTEEKADKVILAIGHSSRDTFNSLIKNGIKAERKDFAVGVRIEHAQDKISKAQYGKNYKKLPPADYKLVSHASERPVFTFCNCPGGYVIAASSEKGGICTNGMSNYARSGANCNSALLVNIYQSDLNSQDLMAGVEFQRNIERKAYQLAGSNYKAPIETVGHLLKKRDSSVSVSPTYPIGTTFVPLKDYLPEFVVKSLKNAIVDFGKKIHGFDSASSLLTGPETRFTSPLKFIRNEEFESVSVKGLYPCGEGSGYAGGITSSSADGLKVADYIIKKYIS